MRGMLKTKKDTHIVERAKEAVFSGFFRRKAKTNCVGQEVKTEIDCELEWRFFSCSERNVFHFGVLHAELNNV